MEYSVVAASTKKQPLFLDWTVLSVPVRAVLRRGHVRCITLSERQRIDSHRDSRYYGATLCAPLKGYAQASAKPTPRLQFAPGCFQVG